jgi:hypothetical protein
MSELDVVIPEKRQCLGYTIAGPRCKRNEVFETGYCRQHQPDGLILVKEGGLPQCKAKSKTTGRRCIRYAVTGYPVCQRHGAGSPFQGRPGGRPLTVGKFSKHLPKDLMARYETAMEDDELLNLSDGIALYETRISKLLEQLPEEDEEGVFLGDLVDAYAELLDAVNAGAVDGAVERLGEIIEAMLGGKSHEVLVWNEVFELFQQQGKLIKQEMNRRIAMDAILTVEEGVAMVKAMEHAVNSIVQDQVTRNAVAAEFFRLFAGTTGN